MKQCPLLSIKRKILPPPLHETSPLYAPQTGSVCRLILALFTSHSQLQTGALTLVHKRCETILHSSHIVSSDTLLASGMCSRFRWYLPSCTSSLFFLFKFANGKLRERAILKTLNQVRPRISPCLKRYSPA